MRLTKKILLGQAIVVTCGLALIVASDVKLLVSVTNWIVAGLRQQFSSVGDLTNAATSLEAYFEEGNLGAITEESCRLDESGEIAFSSTSKIVICSWTTETWTSVSYEEPMK
jgi:hypothetical protein